MAVAKRQPSRKTDTLILDHELRCALFFPKDDDEDDDDRSVDDEIPEAAASEEDASLSFIIEQREWENQFQLLVEWQLQHPRFDTRDTTEDLRIWITQQCVDYTNGNLSEDQIARLERIGLEAFPQFQELQNANKTGNNHRAARSPVKTFGFPFALHAILEDAASTEGTTSSPNIGWLPSGRAFRIYHPKDFTERVLPRYLPHQTRFKSFTRQLNLYGFRMLRFLPQDLQEKYGDGDSSRGAYFHPLFVKGASDLCLGMRRQKIKGKKRVVPPQRLAPNQGGGGDGGGVILDHPPSWFHHPIGSGGDGGVIAIDHPPSWFHHPIQF